MIHKKILIIKFGGLGDIILSLNAIYSIRKQFPKFKTYLLTEKPYDCFLKDQKWFNEIIVIKRSLFYLQDVFQNKKKIKYFIGRKSYRSANF